MTTMRFALRALKGGVSSAVVLTTLMVFHATADAVIGDITFQRDSAGADDTAVAVFPHWRHRIHYKCYVCHPAIFPMKAGASKITMEDMLQGKNCGVCHNGKQAWEVSFDTCPKCHKGE